MVSSVLVELVGDAGEAPSGAETGKEGIESIPGCEVTAWVGEVDVAGMEVEGHVTVPGWLLRGHSVGTWGIGDSPEIYKKARYNITRAFWSVPPLTRPQVCVTVLQICCAITY